MAYFPFFADIQGVRALIVGGGTVARRKAEKLLPYGPRLTVVAERAPDIPGVTLLRRAFRPEDLDGMAFAIAATPDSKLNHRVAELCRGRGIPVNVVDDPAACTFLFPALLLRGSLSAGVSTGGASPTAAAYFKEQFAALLPERLEDILDYLASLRPAVRKAVPEERRGGAFAALLQACLGRARPLSPGEERAVLEEFTTETVR